MNNSIHPDVIKAYKHYNTEYQRIIGGYDLVLRGIMHYKRLNESHFYNTTLFGKDIQTLDDQFILSKKREIYNKIQELKNMQSKIAHDSMIQEYGISNFLDRNIGNAIHLLLMIADATLWIEAEKAGFVLSPILRDSAISLTDCTQHHLVGRSLGTQVTDTQDIIRYLERRVYMHPDKEFPLLNSWIVSNKIPHHEVHSKKRHYNDTVPNKNIYLTNEATLIILILCIQVLLASRNEGVKISLSRDSPEFKENLDYMLIEEHTGPLLDFQGKNGKEIFRIKIGKRGWKMGKNILYIPEKGLQITLTRLAKIIDHEIGTHDATTYADTQLLNNRSHGYRKDEEGMAIFNQRLVTVSKPQDLKKTPTYHHVASLLAESYGYDDLCSILKEYFECIGETRQRAITQSRNTALKVKRYYPLESTGSNGFLLQYTNGYYNLLDMYRGSKDHPEETFATLWKWMHLGKFTTKDLESLKPFLSVIRKKAGVLPKPIYFGRLVYQFIFYNATVTDILEQDIRYKRMGFPNASTTEKIKELSSKVQRIINYTIGIQK